MHKGFIYKFMTVISFVVAVVSIQAVAKNHCLDCHKGIESIVPPQTGMAQALKGFGGRDGTCVVCHGGDPSAVTKAAAHRAAARGKGKKGFFPDPGSPWIVAKTCGQCHPSYTARVNNSLMATEAGKIQGALHTVAIQQDKTVRYGNYDARSLPDNELEGTPAYLAYMKRLAAQNPGPFPRTLKQLPLTDPKRLARHPNEYTFNYLREECLACHVGVSGRHRRGDYRGMGCSSCHIVYSNEGLSQSADPTIPKDQPGHPLYHRLVGTRNLGAGVPTQNCLHCHTRGKRIGTSFTGMMESPYPTPFGPHGESQPRIHGKYYVHIQSDVHYRAGMTCQDCHTTTDIHGDGRIFGTTLAQVEIECSDCHGTTRAYPWELPLGYMDEFSTKPASGRPRGLWRQKSDGSGELLTARGNPFGNVERMKDGTVVLHAVDGRDHQVPLLKALKKQGKLNENALTAMDRVTIHTKKMECYTCHSTWAPQCYGCHVSYDARKKGIDWLAVGNAHRADGTTPDRSFVKGEKLPQLMGRVRESRSYLRWERPILGVNGEGRITPLEPGCQVVSTVVGPGGRSLAHSRVWDSEGVPGLDMAPVFPHTVDKHARSCESCHADPKAAGYGIEGGRFFRGYDKPRKVDVKTDGKFPTAAKVQFNPVNTLPTDWSQVVSRDGRQLQTVGSHWKLSRPLNKRERQTLLRTGTCLGCHRNMGSKVWKRVSTPGSLTTRGHRQKMQKLLRGKAGNCTR